MPTHVLEGDNPVVLPAKPVTFRISGASGVELSMLIDGRRDERALRPVPDKMIVPVVDQPAVVRATPVGGGTFGSNTVVSCTAEIEVRGDHDPERAVLAQADLSGLTGRDLIDVVPDGRGLTLRALGLVSQTELPELAARARDMAREVLGAERAPESERADLTILVDCSASMRPIMTEGSLVAALEVLVGVAQVTSDAVHVRLAGASPRDLPEVPVAELARSSADAAMSEPLAGSVRLDAAPSGRTCIVSDAVTGDAGAGGASGGSGGRAHWLVLAPASSWELLRHRGGSASNAPVPEWGRGDLASTLMQDRQALRDCVVGLVDGLRVAAPTAGGDR